MHFGQLLPVRCVNKPMSSAFVKEDHQSGPPPIIPPRASLPAGTPNYVTPRGLRLLREEMAELEAQRSQVEANHSDEADRTQQLTILNGRLSALSQRLAGAKLVDLASQPTDQIRFGATVTLKTHSGQHADLERTFTIVGVDEASVDEGRLAFVAPIARALLGASLGQTVNLRTGLGEEKAEVVGISYQKDELPPKEPEQLSAG